MELMLQGTNDGDISGNGLFYSSWDLKHLKIGFDIKWWSLIEAADDAAKITFSALRGIHVSHILFCV